MVYGLRAWNTNGHIVIDSEYPVFAEVRRGVLNNNGRIENIFGPNQGYKFDPSGGAIISEGEILGFYLNVGDWVTINPFRDPYRYTTGSGQMHNRVLIGKYSSNAPTLPYVVFADRSNLPAPTGYGMAAYDANGICTWSSDSLVYSIKNTGLIAGESSTSRTYSFGPVTGGNCFFATEGGWNWDPNTTYMAVMGGKRVGAESFMLEKIPLLRTSQSNDGLIGEFDFNYMIGKVS